MSATGPLAGYAQYSDREFLDKNVKSEHFSLYKKKRIFFLPFSCFFGIVSTFFIMLLFCINSLFFFIELIFGEVSEMSADGFLEVVMTAVFTVKYLPVVLLVELFFTTPGMIRRNRENKLVEEFYNGRNIVLDEPRWISKIGYVNRLHTDDLNKGDRIEISPEIITKEGVYFLKNLKCIDHKNMQGSETQTYWSEDSDGMTEYSITTYYYYQIAYFDLDGARLILKSEDYSPAFDTSNSYDILFKINDVLSASNELSGNILKLLVDEAQPLYNPGEVGGAKPNLPQPMTLNNSKAVAA
ncbi:hypothetical protein OAO34_02220 [Candidatus Poseidoniaceae archaeon]|nr:hypothetical protein [Candidatus Poseidoniaceae archaeon]